MSRDEGSTQVLEAVIVATLMVSSVAFVVTFRDTESGDRPERASLAQGARDALAILHETPAEAGRGGSLLDALLMDCLQGECGALDARLRAILPPGVAFAVYLGNGQGELVVYEPRAPSGEAVTTRQSVQPAWSHTLLAPALGVVGVASDPLVVDALPIFHSNVLTPGGSALSVLVRGTRASDNASYVLKTSASTYAASVEDASRTPAASLYFHDGSGVPQAFRDASALTLAASLLPTGASVPFYVRLEESAGVRVPAGTILEVRVPRGWTAVASQPLNGASWLVGTNATDPSGAADGSTVTARLLHDLVGGFADLRLDAVYAGDANDHYPFDARLSRGASASASLLVRADSHVTPPPYETPAARLSHPAPMGATATTTWTLSASIPRSASSVLGDLVRVHSVEVVEESGAGIFGAVTPVSSAGGAWANHGDRLVWTGDAVLSAASPLALTFQVAASGEPSPVPLAQAPDVEVSLDGATLRLQDPVSPGLQRGVILPASAGRGGYDASTGAGLEQTHTLTSGVVHRGVALPGSAEYTASQAAGLRDSLFGSHVQVAHRAVPVGGEVTLAVDVQPVMYEAALLQATPSVALRFYAPSSGAMGIPALEMDLFDGSLLQGPLLAQVDTNGDGSPDPTSLGHFDVTARVPPGWLYGPYLVEVEVSWLEDIEIDGVPTGESILRSARLHDYFVATPPDGIMPVSPVYDVHLVTWLGDWG